MARSKGNTMSSEQIGIEDALCQTRHVEEALSMLLDQFDGVENERLRIRLNVLAGAALDELRAVTEHLQHTKQPC